MIPLPALQPNDEGGVIPQTAAIGTLAGTAVAARARRRNPATDSWLLTARWTLGGAVIGALWVFLARVL
jgi:hypothetical protein